jgi:TP901 family phage tail tape measure protein
MELMAKSGFNMSEVMAGVGGVLDAASASGEGIAETADHISSIMKGMGLNAKDAFGPWESQTQRVADVLAAVSIETKSSIGSLGESMKNVAPVARQLKIPLEDVVMAVGLLQDVGLDASEAGTATATMLTKLAKPADEVAAKMKKMGIAFEDTNGNALPLRDILVNFATAAKEAGGNMDSLAFFADLVGLRGQKAALNLQEMLVSGKFDALAESLKTVHGRASQVANLKMNTTLGDWEKFTSALDGVQTKLFNLESGPLRKIIQRMTAWVEKNEELIVSKAGEWAEKLFVSLEKIADNLPEILHYTEMIGKGLLAWGAFTLTAKAIGLAVGGVSFAIGGVNVALNAMVAFQAGGLLAALGSIAKALLGIEASALAAGTAVKGVGAAGGAAGIGGGLAAAGAVGAAAGGLALAYAANEGLKEDTGGLGFLDLVDEAQRRSKEQGRHVTMAEASDQWRNEQARFAFGTREIEAAAQADREARESSSFVPRSMPLTPVPQAIPQAEAQHRLTEQRTTNVQRSEVVLQTERGVKATAKKKVPGVVIMPKTGGV